MIAGAAITPTIIGAPRESQSTSTHGKSRCLTKTKLGREIFLADRGRHDRQSTKEQSAGDGQDQLHLPLRDERFG
jgi:hypothetical protein